MKPGAWLWASAMFILGLVGAAQAADAPGNTGAPEAAATRSELPRRVIRRADGSEYKPPVPLVIKAPSYPVSMARIGAEGWVLLSLVVQRDGTVRDVAVLDSSRAQFEPKAIEAARNFVYEPAEVDGRPVDGAAARFRITFLFDESLSDAARPLFVRRFREVERRIERGDVEGAAVSLAKMESFGRLNLYEDGFYWWARSMVEHANGELDLRRTSLLRAITYADRDREISLPLELHLRGLANLYADYIRTGELAAALDTYEQLEHRAGKDKVTPELQAHAAAVRALLESDTEIAAQGLIASEHRWVHRLSRDSFEFVDVSGELRRFSLWCEQRAVQLEFSKDASWQVPPGWGACELYVFGEPGTRFQLVEFASGPSTQQLSPAGDDRRPGD